MAEAGPRLGDSLMRLAAAMPAEPMITREQWIVRFQRMAVRNIVAVSPDAVAYPLDARWVIVRVGSFWREDEEYHVYCMDRSIKAMIEHKSQRPEADMMVVTPIWVFSRVGNHAVPTGDEEVLRTAERNYMRFFDDIYKRWKSHG